MARGITRAAPLLYSLSEFGTKVVERFADSAPGANQRSINMFDVRVGASGPVWRNIGRMLSGDGGYGQEFHREGRYAENGVSKLALNFMKPLFAAFPRADGAWRREVHYGAAGAEAATSRVGVAGVGTAAIAALGTTG